MLVRHGLPAQVYRQTSVETATPGLLILMLYRRAILATRRAVQAIEQTDLEKAHNELVRAQAIVIELKTSLNPVGGDLAQGLASLYDFFYQQLLDANLNKDAKLAGEVGTLMQSLLEAWESVINPSTPGPRVVLDQPTASQAD